MPYLELKKLKNLFSRLSTHLAKREWKVLRELKPLRQKKTKKYSFL